MRGIGAGAIALSFAGPVTAGGRAQYIATATGGGARKRVERAGFEVVAELADGDVLGVVGPSDARADLAAVEGVQSAAANHRFRWDGPQDHAAVASETTDDGFWPNQWDKQVTDVAAAHETATGEGSTVAVIDTGVDVDGHPDLPNVDVGAARRFRLVDIKGSFPDPVSAGSGTVEFPADPFDFAAGTTTFEDHVADDVDFHGTHVAGIAAASNDGTTGVAGVAPDATVVPLRVFYHDEIDYDVDDDGEVEEGAAALLTTTLDLFAAIDYAAEIGATVANMSLGTYPLPPQANAGGIRAAEQTVIQSAVRRGTAVVVAAGNDATDLQHGGTFLLPASVPASMAVSATGPNDRLSFYSNYGANTIDVGAPGGGYETLAKTLSTELEDDDDDVDDPDEPGVEWPYPSNLVLSTCDPDSVTGIQFDGAQYVYAAGTSMATPQVAGAVALLAEAAPGASPKRLQGAIERGAALVQGKGDPELGAGRLDLVGALDSLPGT